MKILRLENELCQKPIYELNLNTDGPWDKFIGKLQKKIKQTIELQSSFEYVQQQLSVQKMRSVIRDKELTNLKNIKRHLEDRVGNLQMKAEKVTTLESKNQMLKTDVEKYKVQSEDLLQ